MITLTASELAVLCGATLEGDGSRPLVGPASLDEAGPDQVSFLANPRYRARLETTQAGAVLVPRGVEPPRREVALLVCDNPNRAFTSVIEAFRPELAELAPGVHPSAVVDAGAVIEAGAAVGPVCVVGAGARVGAGAVLGPGTVLGAGASVGAGSRLHAHVVLYPGVRVGERCILHSGTVLGSDGFGFEPTATGWEKVPQCGSVEVGDDCEIGANCTVDRGRFGPTRIGNGVKLDNLVHLAHNVVVEDGALLIAQVGIAGSARLGRGVIVAGQAGVGGHVTVGPGARIAGRAGVTKDIAGGQDYYGYPARPRREALRMEAGYAKLPDLVKRVKELERRLADLDGGGA